MHKQIPGEITMYHKESLMALSTKLGGSYPGRFFTMPFVRIFWRLTLLFTYDDRGLWMPEIFPVPLRSQLRRKFWNWKLNLSMNYLTWLIDGLFQAFLNAKTRGLHCPDHINQGSIMAGLSDANCVPSNAANQVKIQ